MMESTENGRDVQSATPERTSGERALYDQPWLNSILRPMLTALMGAALAIAILAFLARFVPDLPRAYTQGLVLVSLVAALVGCYSTTWLGQPAQRAKRNIGFRTAELGLLLFAVRLVAWGGMDNWPTINTLLLRPVDSLMDGAFIGGAFVVGVAWFMAMSLTDDQLALALQPDDLYLAQTTTDRWQDTARPLYTDRGAIMRRFVGRWVVGGVLLVVLAAGARFDAPEIGFLGIARQRIDPTVIGAIVVYFLSGLILISQGQLALLRSRWTLQKTPTADGIMRNWGVYAGALILLVGLLALLLPLGGTFWAAVIIGGIIRAVYLGLMGLFQTILTLVMLLLSLFTGDETPVEEPPLQEPAQPFLPDPPPPPLFELPPWVGGMVFWIVIALVLGYATYIYFSERGLQWGWLRRFVAALQARWRELFGAYESWQATRLRDQAARDAALGGKGLGGLPAWVRLRNLTPSQQVRYFYLSTLQRAAGAGLPRRPSETPLRYAPRLARFIEEHNQEHPDEEADVEELTAAFLRVRYADTTVDTEELPILKLVWERLRRYLKL